ncbi:la domain, partial [Schistosoma japonicum]
SVPSSENNSLEADLGPSSAPAEQREFTSLAEEKPKSKTDTSRHAFTGKLKWHNYEVDDATCAFLEWRGRLSVGPFAGANYTSGNVRSFRQRGRGSNGFYRQSGRSANTRPVNEPKENMSESNRNKRPVDIHLGTDVSSHDEKVQEPSSSPSELVEVSGKAETDLQNKLNTVPTVSGPTPRKNYRERSNVSSQSGGQPANIPLIMMQVPLAAQDGRINDSILQCYSAETDNHNLNSHSTL